MGQNAKDYESAETMEYLIRLTRPVSTLAIPTIPSWNVDVE